MADEIIVETTSTEVIEVGVPGPQGATGQGVPVGGTTGQVLRKASGTNYDTEWAAAGSGSGSVTSVSLAGTGLSISGSPITTSGTITANVAYGTTAGTATQGNDSRIANIAANSITTSGNDVGDPNGGYIDTSGSDEPGGNIDTSGGSGAGAVGGSINTSGNSAAGGSINTSDGGGSINTRGTGSVELGVSGTRTALTGTATANRAISLPNASGTIALTSDFAAPPAIGNTTPAAGTFTTLNATNGTITASAPVLDLAQTWNNAAVTFSGARIDITNTASATGSRFLDCIVGGAAAIRLARIGSTPYALFGTADTGIGAISTSQASIIANGGVAFVVNSGSGGAYIRSDASYAWASSTNLVGASSDLTLARDAADTLAQRRTTNPQAFRLYNTFTSATNFERLNFAWSSNVAIIGTEKGSAGGTARALAIQTDGTTRISIGTAGQLGFFGAAAAAQPTAVADATDAATVITQLNALLSRMRTLGLIAT